MSSTPFDLTKVWPHKDYPLIDVGVLELNRNPENYFAEVEQAAFSPSNLPPGIGDFHLIEKLAHFNRERVPERVVTPRVRRLRNIHRHAGHHQIHESKGVQ